MINILKTFLENAGDIVPADELGKNWTLFVIFVCVIVTLPWIALIIYSIFFKKYRVRYFYNNECVHTEYYKKGQNVNLLVYQNVEWYLDSDLTEKVLSYTIEDKNIKLFGKEKDV